MRKILIIILVIVILIGLGVVLYYLYGDQILKTKKVLPAENKSTATQTTMDTNPAPVKKITFTPAPNDVVTAEKPVTRTFGKSDLERLSASFAERYGSFSNQSNFSNITDLRIFMSADMKNWADNYIALERQKKTDATTYYGIVTKAIAQEIKDFDEDFGQAKVLVQTRRREALGTTNNVSNVFNQAIIIEFVKEQGAWKVDKATWQSAGNRST
jgi:hypothetical protein